MIFLRKILPLSLLLILLLALISCEKEPAIEEIDREKVLANELPYWGDVIDCLPRSFADRILTKDPPDSVMAKLEPKFNWFYDEDGERMKWDNLIAPESFHGWTVQLGYVVRGNERVARRMNLFVTVCPVRLKGELSEMMENEIVELYNIGDFIIYDFITKWGAHRKVAYYEHYISIESAIDATSSKGDDDFDTLIKLLDMRELKKLLEATR